MALEEGFRVNPAKTRVRGRGDQQRLAGLVVNERPAIPRADYDRLRAVLHNAARDGLDAANRDGHPDFAAHLAGLVAWASHGHPARAARLQRLLRAACMTRRGARPLPGAPSSCYSCLISSSAEPAPTPTPRMPTKRW